MSIYNEPQKFLDFYNWRRQKLSEVEPNQAHCLIADCKVDVQFISYWVDFQFPFFDGVFPGFCVHVEHQRLVDALRHYKFDCSFVFKYCLNHFRMVGVQKREYGSDAF